MSHPRAAALLALAILATACSSSHHAAPATKPKPTACDPGDDSCIPPDHPTTTPIAVPPAKVGQPMNLQIPTDGGTAQIQLTPTGIKVRPLEAPANPQDDEVCLGVKIKNTGTLTWKAGDTTAGISWTWFGLDGQQVDDPITGISGWCDRYHLGTEFDGANQPAPLPGKYAQGVYGIAVPGKPGALEITDSQGAPLFRVNYGPKSAQVPIDARGQ